MNPFVAYKNFNWKELLRLTLWSLTIQKNWERLKIAFKLIQIGEVFKRYEIPKKILKSLIKFTRICFFSGSKAATTLKHFLQLNNYILEHDFYFVSHEGWFLYVDFLILNTNLKTEFSYHISVSRNLRPE